MKRQIVVRGIAIHAGKLLAVEQRDAATKQPRGFWCLPGGVVEDGEEILQAITREMIEETGVNPVVGKLLYVQQLMDKKNNIERLEFFFYIQNPEDYQDIDLSKTTHGEKELAQIGFINPVEKKILPDFLQTADLTNIENQALQFFAYL